LTPADVPITPSVEVWRGMSADARATFINDVNSILSSPLHFMGESIPHNRAKRRAIDLLRKHFRAIGRVFFLAEKFTAFYPGERAFTPDILGIRDVPETEEDERGGWVVADEGGRGVDLVIEVLWEGDRDKDLVKNVERYAQLGIPEYFIYDRKKQNLIGYRLPAPQARRYQRIIPQGGRHLSTVLGLDLALLEGKLEFYHGMSEIFGSEDLIARLESMMSSLEAKAADATAKAADATAKATRAITSLRESVFAIADARGIVYSEADREQIDACEDPTILQRWLVRIVSAHSMAEALTTT
jgi:Uma2 family endonuclease